MRTVRHETQRDLISLVMPDGEVLATERTITHIDDWRETALGPVNFGRVIIGPSRRVREPA